MAEDKCGFCGCVWTTADPVDECPSLDCAAARRMAMQMAQDLGCSLGYAFHQIWSGYLLGRANAQKDNNIADETLAKLLSEASGRPWLYGVGLRTNLFSGGLRVVQADFDGDDRHPQALANAELIRYLVNNAASQA